MDLEQIRAQVKSNCNISDARYWGYLSLCNMLLRLRELYLHEHNLRPWDQLNQKEVSAWIHERESLWNEIEEKDLQPIHIDGNSYDPFDAEAISKKLEPTGTIYGSGIGVLKKPIFFLGKVKEHEDFAGIRIWHVHRESCRDLSPFVAMRQDKNIYIRLDLLASYLFTKYLDFRKGSKNDILTRAFLYYGFDGSENGAEGFTEKMEHLTESVAPLIVMHEKGEATEHLGEELWLDLLGAAPDKYVELRLRAIKDLAADTGDSGPLQHALHTDDDGIVLFYLTLMDETRRQIFPEIRRAWEEVSSGNDRNVLARARTVGHSRARRMMEALLESWRNNRNMEEIKEKLGVYFALDGSGL